LLELDGTCVGAAGCWAGSIRLMAPALLKIIEKFAGENRAANRHRKDDR
jgi:hypothetical protein